MNKRINIETEFDLNCPICNSEMIPRRSKFGIFYGCQDYFFNGCHGRIGARLDGTPIKIPENKEVQSLKELCKSSFNKLWEENIMNKHEAYSWLCEKMKLSRDKGVIDNFTVDQCKFLIKEIISLLESKGLKCLK